MSAKSKTIIIQEENKDYGEEAVEETKKLIQGDDKFDREDKEFEAAHADEITFNKSLAEESAARARSHKARSMARYNTRTENDTEEEEEEENSKGNRKQPETNPIRGSHGW